MTNKEASDKLRTHLKKLKKQKLTPSVVKTIMRVKALIAYYKGSSIDVVARCYDISEKSLQRWIKEFETYGLEGLGDEDRSGRPTKLPKDKQATKR